MSDHPADGSPPVADPSSPAPPDARSKEKERRREERKKKSSQGAASSKDAETDGSPPHSPADPSDSADFANNHSTTGGGAAAAGEDEDDGRPPVVVDPSKDLWFNIAANVKDSGAAADGPSINALFVGSPDAGKTTLLQRFLQTSSGGGGRKVKPTTALDYTFTRRADRNVSQVAHLWELAQGIDLAQLADVVVTPENIHSMVLCVVVDGSDAGLPVLWETACYWLKQLDRRVSEVLSRMRAKGSSTPDKLIGRATKQIGTDHPDLTRMRISGVPTVLVVNKMDRFSGGSQKLKLLSQSIRFLAHLYGAQVIFTGEDDSVTKWRSLLTHLVFQAPFDTRFIQFDPERGSVLLTPDKDTFMDIGDPPITNYSAVQSRGMTRGDGELDRWAAPFDEAFQPQPLLKSSEDARVQDSFIKKLYEMSDDGFGEATIDALRKQKDEELDQYRKSAKTKERGEEKRSRQA